MIRTPNIFKFRTRTVLALLLSSLVGCIGFLSPFLGIENAWFAWVTAPIALALLISEISNQRIDGKSVALLGVLTALTAALRSLGAGAVGVEPMWFLLILAARVFGPSFGFILGISSLFLSAFLTGGFGPWLAFQMFAAGWIGMGAGLLPQRVAGFLIRKRGELVLLVFYGIFSSFTFGFLMDLQFWPWALGSNTQLSYLPNGSLGENFHRFITYHFASSMAWDIPRAFITSALVLVAAPAVLNTLRRTLRRASFFAPIEFAQNRDLAIAHAKRQMEV